MRTFVGACFCRYFRHSPKEFRGVKHHSIHLIRLFPGDRRYFLVSLTHFLFFIMFFIVYGNRNYWRLRQIWLYSASSDFGGVDPFFRRLCCRKVFLSPSANEVFLIFAQFGNVSYMVVRCFFQKC